MKSPKEKPVLVYWKKTPVIFVVEPNFRTPGEYNPKPKAEIIESRITETQLKEQRQQTTRIESEVYYFFLTGVKLFTNTPMLK